MQASNAEFLDNGRSQGIWVAAISRECVERTSEQRLCAVAAGRAVSGREQRLTRGRAAEAHRVQIALAIRQRDMLDEVGRMTGVPVVVNTSLNTAGRPMVDSPRDALECFGSAPVDALAIGPFLLERR